MQHKYLNNYFILSHLFHKQSLNSLNYFIYLTHLMILIFLHFFAFFSKSYTRLFYRQQKINTKLIEK